MAPRPSGSGPPPRIPPRYELKYIVDEGLRDAIRDRIEGFSVRDPHSDERGNYEILSLYFDSVDYLTHRQKAHRQYKRFKLRMRTYGGSGAPRLAEVKRREGDRVIKTRALIDGPLQSALDPEADAAEALHDFASMAGRHGAEPTVLVKYRREAWASEVDEYARVTFDSALEYQPWTDLNFEAPEHSWMSADDPGALGTSGSRMILELKFSEQAPTWMSNMVRDLSLWRVGFSKYCTAIDKLLGKRRPATPHRSAKY